MSRLNRNITQRKTLNRAFTLIEVVLALAIASISLLVLLKLHLVSTVLADRAEVSTQAVLLAYGKIAEALAEGYPNPGVTTGSVQHGSTTFQWHREVADNYPYEFNDFYPDLSLKGIRKISININWRAGNADKNLFMSTYVADLSAAADRKLK